MRHRLSSKGYIYFIHFTRRYAIPVTPKTPQKGPKTPFFGTPPKPPKTPKNPLFGPPPRPGNHTWGKTPFFCATGPRLFSTPSHGGGGEGGQTTQKRGGGISRNRSVLRGGGFGDPLFGGFWGGHSDTGIAYLRVK